MDITNKKIIKNVNASKLQVFSGNIFIKSIKNYYYWVVEIMILRKMSHFVYILSTPEINLLSQGFSMILRISFKSFSTKLNMRSPMISSV